MSAVLCVSLALVVAGVSAVPLSRPETRPVRFTAPRGALLPDPRERVAEVEVWEHAAAVARWEASERRKAERLAAAERARERPQVARSARSRSAAPETAGGVWAALRACENGGSYTSAPGDRYRGAYQFSPSTWASVGGSGDPADAPPAEQDARARQLQARSGFGQWPSCARKLGLI